MCADTNRSAHISGDRRSLTGERLAAARRVFEYLAEVDALPASADVAIGYGVFDLALPRYCADLYVAGRVKGLIFTGGIGAGTGDLGGPEAVIWREEIRRSHPAVPSEAIVVENRSTNTAENINYTADLLRRDYPALAFGTGTTSALIVASPSRLRRVRLTMLKLQPAVKAYRTLPAVDFDREFALYTKQGVDYVDHLAGEIDRIVAYPQRGWIAEEPVPGDVLAAAAVLRR